MDYGNDFLAKKFLNGKGNAYRLANWDRDPRGPKIVVFVKKPRCCVHSRTWKKLL